METVQRAGHVRGARATQWYIGPADLDGEPFTKDELRIVRRFLHSHVPVQQEQSWEITKERWSPKISYYFASKIVWSPGIRYGAYTLETLLEKITHYYEEMGHVEEEIKKKYGRTTEVPPLMGQ